jgi:hypothetical protein
MSRQKQQQRPVIHREDANESWLVRETTGGKTERRDGTTHCTISVELVFGKRVHHEGQSRIDGKTYHLLHGPTARKSMDAFAAKLNAEKTPPTEIKRCLADGSRPPKDGGPGQREFADLLRKPNPTP